MVGLEKKSWQELYRIILRETEIIQKLQTPNEKKKQRTNGRRLPWDQWQTAAIEKNSLRLRRTRNKRKTL